MSTQAASYVTQEEYLERERVAEAKHEYIEGAVVAMAGGSPAHALVIANVTSALVTHLTNSGCVVFSSDLRVCVRQNKLITYPDVTIACPPLAYVDDRRDTVTNPRVVVEVMSPSTRDYDRGAKSWLYRTAPSIQEYLLIEPTEVEIEHGRKLENGRWEIEIIRDQEAVIELKSVGCQLPLNQVYAHLEILDA